MDENCDGVIDDGFATLDQWPDEDGDGFGDGTRSTVEVCVGTPGFATQDGDCNDTNSNVFPSQGAYFLVPPCDEIVGERTCALPDDGIGCQRGGSCVEVDFDYDCSGAPETNLPHATCSFTGSPTCVGPGSCTEEWSGTGYIYSTAKLPCGQEVEPADGCDCTSSVSCGAVPPTFALPTPLACH